LLSYCCRFAYGYISRHCRPLIGFHLITPVTYAIPLFHCQITPAVASFSCFAFFSLRFFIQFWLFILLFVFAFSFSRLLSYFHWLLFTPRHAFLLLFIFWLRYFLFHIFRLLFHNTWHIVFVGFTFSLLRHIITAYYCRFRHFRLPLFSILHSFRLLFITGFFDIFLHYAAISFRFASLLLSYIIFAADYFRYYRQLLQFQLHFSFSCFHFLLSFSLFAGFAIISLFFIIFHFAVFSFSLRFHYYYYYYLFFFIIFEGSLSFSLFSSLLPPFRYLLRFHYWYFFY